MAPPVEATTPDGAQLDLRALAQAACRAYQAEYPDEQQRYGSAGLLWCVHDNQHLLNWAALSLAKWVDFEEKLAWLARVLEARTFPLPRLARNLELLSATVRDVHPEQVELTEVLRNGAVFVGAHGSFL